MNFVTDTVYGQSQQVLQIAVSSMGTEAGVQTQTNPFISSSNYSAVLLAKFRSRRRTPESPRSSTSSS
ncbi:MAG: hypothetical protein M3R59_02950 [Verrucomicrobiota bacterium]|nr:hypothetical protein [Verrucomicrobiota bacterium]